jgi:hypothetical protein
VAAAVGKSNRRFWNYREKGKRWLHFFKGKIILNVLPTSGSDTTSNFPPEDWMNRSSYRHFLIFHYACAIACGQFGQLAGQIHGFDQGSEPVG